MEETLVLVDENDNKIGTAGKLECHIGAGKLHRAFTALIFDSEGRLLLTQRSPRKMLWGGIWDATFASHPRVSESYVDAGVRRMPDELGCSCDMYIHSKFIYHVRDGNAGSENEVCGILVGRLADTTNITATKSEISMIGWEDIDTLVSKIQNVPSSYCPWMLAALWFLYEPTTQVVDKETLDIIPKVKSGALGILKNATDSHMKGKWREVPWIS